MATGRDEMVERLAEAANQLLTSVLNGLPQAKQLEHIARLEAGAHIEVLTCPKTLHRPFSISMTLVMPNGERETIATYQ